MEEVRRVSTVKKSKKVTTILLIVVGVLGIALLGVAWYFSTIGDKEDDSAQATTKTCACYFLDPEVLSECGDPKRGFQFVTKTVSGDGTVCTATCSNADLLVSQLNSDTKQDDYLTCPISTITDTRCAEMVIKDADGKVVTGNISSDEKITIEATFDSQYVNHKFYVNNESSDPDSTSADGLTITKTLSGFSSSTLSIYAAATDGTGEQITSTLCKRVLNVEQKTSSVVSNLTASTRIADGVFKVSELVLAAGNLTGKETLHIIFSFETEKSTDSFTNLKMTKGFVVDASKGTITILETDLYNADNFSTGKSFSILDNYQGTLTITAELRNDTSSIGEQSVELRFPNAEEIAKNEASATEEANFTVTTSSDITCVERVSPDNIVNFTVTVTNSSASTQLVNSVKDKLPLGFVYTTGSTKVNGVVSDDAIVTNVGSTQELVWSVTGGWSLASNQSILITFEAQAGANALTGANLNEVVITPEQIPTDPDSLSFALSISVQQDCDNPTSSTTGSGSTPTTGLFDSTLSRIVVGLVAIVIGWFIYNRPLGKVVVKKFVDSDAYRGAEMASWRVFKPRKYFEEKALKKMGTKRPKR